MVRNIVLIILFIVLYGGMFMLSSQKAEETTDRNGFGEFYDNKYSCEACNFEMEFKPDWITMDGVTIEKMYTSEELLDYGNPGEYDFIAGIASPKFELLCVRYKNCNLDKSCFTISYLYHELDYYKENVALAGGTLSGSGCNVIQAQGNGADMAYYYCDYTLDDQFYSIVNCYVNCGKDYICFTGYYENRDGLDEIIEFLNTGLTFNSSSAVNV